MITANTLLDFDQSWTDSQTGTRSIGPDYDVVVVGARAAGAATAMLLARRGFRVLAVDRSAYGSDTLSTHSLARTGVLQLSRWGLLDRLREAGTPAARTVVFHYGDEPAILDVSADHDVDGLYSPRRTVLDRILVDAAVQSGADVCHGVTAAGLTRDGTDRVNGLLLDIDGIRVRVGATWVVGADGARSLVARDVAAPVIHQEQVTSAVRYGYWNGLADDVLRNFYDVRGRAVGIVPTNDGQACVWVAMSPQRFRAATRRDPRAAYLDEVRTSPQLADLLADATYVGGSRAFPGVPGFLRQSHGPGWALVGDAGYFKDPVSAHGITDAFTCAELLTDALDAAMCASDDTPLDTYARQRDAMAGEMMPPVAALASMELDPAGARAAFREMGGALRSEWALMTSRDLVGAAR